MRKLRPLIAFLILTTMVGVFNAGPVAAQATDFCESDVYAGTSAVDPNDPELIAAIDAVEAEGVDVHIIVDDSVDGLSYEEWIARSRVRCPSWSNEADDDIGIWHLIISIAIEDRIIDPYAGSALTFELGGKDVIDQVRDNQISPAIGATQGEDVNPGLIAGLNRVHEILTAPDEPVATGGEQGPGASSSEPEDSVSGVWLAVILGSMVGIVAVIFIGYLLMGWLERRRERREAYEAAEQEAHRAVAQMKNAIGDLILTDELGDTPDRLRGRLALADTTEVTELLREIDHLEDDYRRLVDAFTKTQAEPTTLGGWQAMADNAKDAIQRHTKFVSGVRTVEHNVELHFKKRHQAMNTANRIKRRLKNVGDSLPRMMNAGFKTDFIDEQVSEITAQLAIAIEHYEMGRFNASLEALEPIEKTLLPQAKRDADNLPKMAETLRSRAGKLRVRLDAHRRMAVEVKGVFHALEARYREAVVSEVAGFGSEAERMLDEAEQLIAGIEPEVAREVQNYVGARTLVEQAGLLLHEAHTELNEVLDLRDELEKAHAQVGPLHGRTRRKLADALAYCRSVETDAGQDEINGLVSVQRRLDELSELFDDETRDPRETIKRLKRMQANIDLFVKRAEEDYRNARMLEAELEEIRQEAIDSIKAATKHVKKHKSDVRRSTREALEDVTRRSQRAHNMTVAEAIIYWQLIDNDADDVVTKSKSNVSAAKQARRTSYNNSSSSGSRTSYPSSGSSGSRMTLGGFGSGSGSRSSISIGRSSGSRGGW